MTCVILKINLILVKYLLIVIKFINQIVCHCDKCYLYLYKYDYNENALHIFTTLLSIETVRKLYVAHHTSAMTPAILQKITNHSTSYTKILHDHFTDKQIR